MPILRFLNLETSNTLTSWFHVNIIILVIKGQKEKENNSDFFKYWNDESEYMEAIKFNRRYRIVKMKVKNKLESFHQTVSVHQDVKFSKIVLIPFLIFTLESAPNILSYCVKKTKDHWDWKKSVFSSCCFSHSAISSK